MLKVCSLPNVGRTGQEGTRIPMSGILPDVEKSVRRCGQTAARLRQQPVAP